ncbi:MAG: PLD nuclease N-terminal domain-containing protein [Halorubrum sp.]
MEPLAVAILAGLPLAWLAAFAAYVYVDAPKHGMNRRKWAAIAFFVPLFGFFAYLFEREELDYDPTDDPHAGGGDDRQAGFAVHESRRGERPLGPAGTEADDRDGGSQAESTDGTEEYTGEDEWNDPDGVDI